METMSFLLHLSYTCRWNTHLEIEDLDHARRFILCVLGADPTRAGVRQEALDHVVEPRAEQKSVWHVPGWLFRVVYVANGLDQGMWYPYGKASCLKDS